jgi:molybdopterin molybdotransferase
VVKLRARGVCAAHTVEEAQRIFWSALPQPALAREIVPLADALGRVLAEDQRAKADVPAFRRSTMDGFAVPANAAARLRVVGEVRMGHPAPSPVRAGECVAIPTGGMLPEGAVAVVPIEHVRREGELIEISQPASAGENVVDPGEDVRRGEVVVPAGRRLRPADVSALASVGIERVPALARPRVAILSTGDELVGAGQEPAPGQVRESNAAGLYACVLRDGGAPVPCGIVRDDADEVRLRLRSALESGDLLLVSGGSSVGERDFVPAALAAMGRPGMLLHGVALKPGKPTGFFVLDGRVAVSLPGHPVSALVVYELFVRPALLRLGGDAAWQMPRGFVEAELTEAVSAPRDRDFYCRVRVEGGRAVPMAGGSSLLSSLVHGSGLLRVPQGTRHNSGDRVRVEIS